MRIPDLAAVERLVTAEVEESGVLDYKQDLVLKSRTERRELCRDLTAIGNAGGGTLIFGVREVKDRDGIPEAIKPLTDSSLPLLVADIVRDSVRPPLLYEAAANEVDGGYVLVVDVEPSGLGPYMIIAYDEFRFWTRHGKSNSPMSEAEVRDAYDLALRWANRQGARWNDRALPLRSRDVNSLLSVSAIPREPAADILDLRQLELDALRPPTFIQEYLRHGGLNPALHGLRRWADGFTYDPEPPTSASQRAWYVAIRVHRDGSIGSAEAVGPDLEVGRLLRTLNGHLLYAGWLWTQFELRRPVELRVELDGVQFCQIPKHLATTALAQPVQPAGMPVTRVSLVREVLPWEVTHASARHRIVQEFSDRLVQTFGGSRYDDLFGRGWLFGRGGTALPYLLHGGGIITGERGPLGAPIDDVGAVRNNLSQICAYVVDGVVLDTDGNAVAVLEFAPGAGCPIDFLAGEGREDFDTTTVPVGVSQATTAPAPAPTGSWSSQALADVLASR